MSHEHAWPQWMGKHAGDLEPSRSSRQLGFGRVAEDALAEHETVITTKPGSVLNARIREVGQTCNNGWMSAMETRAEPMLMRLWASTPTFGRTAISVDDAAFLATWAAKTGWMHERVSVWKPTATSEMRSYLMDKQLDFAHFLANFDVSHQDQPWDSSDQRRVLVVAMAFKGLAFAVRTGDGWGVSPMPHDAQRWQRLWPVTEVVPWPPAQVLSDDDVVSVTHYYSSWLLTPDVPNFHRHPGA